MSSEAETDISEALIAITECSVCRKLMKEAAFLPCLHTFCLECLGNRRTNTTVTCPSCDKKYPTADIRRDHFIQDVIDEGLSPNTSGGSGSSICDFCIDDDLDSENGLGGTGFKAEQGTLDSETGSDRTGFRAESRTLDSDPGSDRTRYKAEPGTLDSKSGPDGTGLKAEPRTSLATLHCLDCRKNLCASCARSHKRHCRSHVVVDRDDVLVRRRSLARSVARCVEHPDENLKIFCCDCRTVVCVLCYAESHNTHQCKDIAKAANDFQRQLREVGAWMDVYTAGMSSALTDLDKEWRMFEENLRDTRSKILDKGEEMKRIVDDHVTRLTQELQSLSQKRSSEFESAKKAFNALLSDVDHLKKYSQAVTENGSPYHVAACFPRLQDKAAELKVTRPQLNGNTGQRVKVIFAKPDPLERIKGETEAVLGRVWVSEVSDTTEEDDNKVNGEAWAKLIGTVETDGRGVMGVTILHSKLYIVCAWTNTVFVHAAEHPFSRIETVLVKDMKCPNDIASCSQSNCLYVPDSEFGCVWRINEAGQSDRWVGKAGQPWTISVRHGRVLLPADGKPPQLNIYGPGGGILQRIRLPSAVEFVQHAVELRNGSFIVSHGRNSGRTSRICEVSKTGHIVRGFDGAESKGSSSRSALVRWPKHLAVDESEETVLVAEFSNHYVLRLSRSLQLELILLSWDDDRIDAPTRLCWVPGTGRVLLAEPACVKVYDVPDLRSKSSDGTSTKKPDLFDVWKK